MSTSLDKPLFAIHPEIENASYVGADRSASIILTLEGEPDYLFYKHTDGDIEKTGSDLVEQIVRINRWADQPSFGKQVLTRDLLKNVLRSIKDPITKKRKYRFIDVGHNISTPDHCKYEYHLNFGMPANAVELLAYSVTDCFEEESDFERLWLLDALSIMPTDDMEILKTLINPDHNWLKAS